MKFMNIVVVKGCGERRGEMISSGFRFEMKSLDPRN